MQQSMSSRKAHRMQIGVCKLTFLVNYFVIGKLSEQKTTFFPYDSVPELYSPVSVIASLNYSSH